MWTLFHDDLESELESWQGFEDSLTDSRSKMRSKDFVAYRNATWACDIALVPDTLQVLVAAVREYRLSVESDLTATDTADNRQELSG